VAPHEIRIIGDPVLKQPARVVEEIDGRIARLADDMLETMYEAPGLGLAAPQVGIQKQVFVYDMGTGPATLVNPEIVETDGEWLFDEGCLSVPGLSWEIVRPKTIHLVGRDLDGDEVSIEADELESRLFQHELDHLNGILLTDHLDDEQRLDARKALQELALSRSGPAPVEAAEVGEIAQGLRLP
jgi:peptide deformylase